MNQKGGNAVASIPVTRGGLRPSTTRRNFPVRYGKSFWYYALLVVCLVIVSLSSVQWTGGSTTLFACTGLYYVILLAFGIGVHLPTAVMRDSQGLTIRFLWGYRIIPLKDIVAIRFVDSGSLNGLAQISHRPGTCWKLLWGFPTEMSDVILVVTKGRFNYMFSLEDPKAFLGESHITFSRSSSQLMASPVEHVGEPEHQGRYSTTSSHTSKVEWLKSPVEVLSHTVQNHAPKGREVQVGLTKKGWFASAERE